MKLYLAAALVAATLPAYAQNLPPGFLAALANTIPENCQAPQAKADMLSQIPGVLQLGPEAARIRHVSALAPLEAHSMDPQGHYGLINCPVVVRWSNGLTEHGYFSEWQDQYGQKMVAYGPNTLNGY